MTPPGGVGYAGAPFWREVAAAAQRDVPDAPVAIVLDCGDDAAQAVEAIRDGWRDLVLDAASPAASRVADIAERAGARLRALGPPALDLDRVGDPAAASLDLLLRGAAESLNGGEACGT